MWPSSTREANGFDDDSTMIDIEHVQASSIEDEKSFTSGEQQSHTFVKAWEGLRGVAVILVCWCHLGVWGPFDQYLARCGVGTFFVLSGFLITNVLQRKLDKVHDDAGTIRLRNCFSYNYLGQFYWERSVRLYPALIFMLLTTAVMASVCMPSLLDGTFFTQAAYAALYLTDIQPFGIWQNTWSLAVEEQFYIWWSLLLPFLMRISYAARVFIVSLLFFITFGLGYASNAGLAFEPAYVYHYFGPIQNFSKIIFGALVCLCSAKLPRFLRTASAGWTGMAIMAVYGLTVVPTSGPLDLSVFGFDQALFGWKVMLDPMVCVAATLMILGTQHAGNVLLELRPVRYFGRISYALYLFQAPLFLLREKVSEKKPTGLDGFVYTLAAILLATFSTFYVEDPIRNYVKAISRRRR